RQMCIRDSPTPGLVEAVRAGWVLAGEPEWLERFRMPPPQEIPPWESRRLLANRTLEWLEARAREPRDVVGLAYAEAKLHADAGAAILLAKGLFAGGGFEERGRRAAVVLDLPEEERERIVSWTAWRLAPSPELPGGRSIEEAGGAQGCEAVARTIGCVIGAVATNSSVRHFLGGPTIQGRTWARAWKRWIRARSASLVRPDPHVIARTPRVLLWEAALELAGGRPAPARSILRRIGLDAPEEEDALARRIAEAARWMERLGVE
ncbi:MAG: hypothetical protein QUU85_19315, partial [Candidatus Eisenbacteria bacterium]|nr:hypothetical protein [Candidatus Eisenbacteria bacterium]